MTEFRAELWGAWLCFERESFCRRFIHPWSGILFLLYTGENCKHDWIWGEVWHFGDYVYSRSVWEIYERFNITVMSINTKLQIARPRNSLRQKTPTQGKLTSDPSELMPLIWSREINCPAIYSHLKSRTRNLVVMSVIYKYKSGWKQQQYPETSLDRIWALKPWTGATASQWAARLWPRGNVIIASVPPSQTKYIHPDRALIKNEWEIRKNWTDSVLKSRPE